MICAKDHVRHAISSIMGHSPPRLPYNPNGCQWSLGP
jgi:hypothetical protein